MTRAQLIELIQRDLNNGLPHDDAQVSDNEIGLWLSQAIAIVMEERYKTSSELESITYMNDFYYATFKNRSVSKDTDTGYYYFTLPQVPLGLPRGISIAGVYFKSAEGLAAFFLGRVQLEELLLNVNALGLGGVFLLFGDGPFGGQLVYLV